MAKRKRNVTRHGQNFNASEELDDHLLPSSQELAEYKQIDPTIIDFLKERAIIEQEHRHEMNTSLTTLNKREQFLTHGINYLALIVGAIVLLVAMYISYKLILQDKVITGSVFGGISLAWVLYMLVSASRRGQMKTPQ
jgi:uncharacterized membrane protein